jgi:hypothetical protein
MRVAALSVGSGHAWSRPGLPPRALVAFTVGRTDVAPTCRSAPVTLRSGPGDVGPVGGRLHMQPGGPGQSLVGRRRSHFEPARPPTSRAGRLHTQPGWAWHPRAGRRRSRFERQPASPPHALVAFTGSLDRRAPTCRSAPVTLRSGPGDVSPVGGRLHTQPGWAWHPRAGRRRSRFKSRFKRDTPPHLTRWSPSQAAWMGVTPTCRSAPVTLRTEPASPPHALVAITSSPGSVTPLPVGSGHASSPGESQRPPTLYRKCVLLQANTCTRTLVR